MNNSYLFIKAIGEIFCENQAKIRRLSKHRNKISSGAIYEKHAAHLRHDSHAWNFNGIQYHEVIPLLELR